MMSSVLFEILFYLFMGLTLLGALTVILSKNSVRAVISLILTFVAAATVWMLMQVEFLALVLIVVYVGAVMVLFMFVVMMIPVEEAQHDNPFVKYWPIAGVIGIVFFALIAWGVGHHVFDLQHYPQPTELPADYSSIRALGVLLYSQYLYPFIIAGMILFSAMVAAITLTFRGKRTGLKGLTPAVQTAANPRTRFQMVNMPVERPDMPTELPEPTQSTPDAGGKSS